MLYAVCFTCVHVIVHVLLYALPRAAWAVCVRLPIAALSFLLGVRLCGGDADAERHVRILGPVGSVGATAAATARERFGVSEAQLSNPALHHSHPPLSRPSDTGVGSATDAAGASGVAGWMRYSGPLYNGHIHTILGAHRPPLDLRPPERVVVPSYDANPTCLDWWVPTPAETAAAAAACQTAAGVRVRALAVVLPGLTGSSSEFYVRRMARELLAANVAVCVLNARGVGDTPLEQPQIFSALFTKDLRYVMSTYLTREKVREKLLREMPPTEQPDASTPLPVIGVAFSLGGLIMSNYVSEQGAAGQDSGLDAVYTITSPHHVSDGAAAMRSLVVSTIYGPTLFGGLRRYYERHKSVIQRLPGLDHRRLFTGPRPLIDQLRVVQDFDEHITGPHFGFAGAEAYYSHASNFRRLHASRTPQVCVVAANDPICGPPQPDPLWLGMIERHTAGLLYVEMPVGGHLGFVESPLREWLQQPNVMERFVLHSITHFLDSVGCDYDGALTKGNV